MDKAIYCCRGAVGRLVSCTKCLPPFRPCSKEEFGQVSERSNCKDHDIDETAAPRIPQHTHTREPGGWKAMPYVIGNETFERLATLGLLANFMVYLLNQFHLNQVSATNVINVWSGTTNFAPLFGAFLSDAYFGRFRTLAFASVASFLGMVTLTLTALVPSLKPPKCDPLMGSCSGMGPSKGQLGILYLALGLLTVGSGGIRPCSLPFGVDQFDPTTEKGRQQIDSFFNWYYFTFNIAMIIAFTVIIYVQDSVSWALGLGIPALFMLCSIILFFLGTRIYVYVPPEGSVFSGIAQAIVAAFRKRKLALPPAEEQAHILYDPPPKGSTVTKLPLTQQFSFLNKAAIVTDGELKSDGSPENPWRLGSVQHIEELKCLIRIVPIWIAGIICFLAMAQQSTFTLSQALKMDRRLGRHFRIPAGSLVVINLLALTAFIPIYDRLLVPAARRLTKQPSGITLLQRMGIGIAVASLSMVVAGMVEVKRRRSAILHGGKLGIAPISVLWLAPQLALMGVAEAFNAIGQLEFYYKQFPEHMRSISGALLFCTLAGASYLSTIVVSVVHKSTRRNGVDWLDNDINKGKLEYFYYIIAGMGGLNLLYFLVCSHFYRYKEGSPDRQKITTEEGGMIELNTPKLPTDG